MSTCLLYLDRPNGTGYVFEMSRGFNGVGGRSYRLSESGTDSRQTERRGIRCACTWL